MMSGTYQQTGGPHMQSEQREASADSALGLKKLGHESWFLFYVAGAALVSLLVYVFMGESSRRSYLEREARELHADDGEPANTPAVSAIAS